MIDFNLDKYMVDKEGTLIDAMNVLTKNHQGIGFICQGRKLCAAISDGDIRRWIIASGNLNDKAGGVANYKPRYVRIGEEKKGELFLDKYHCTAIPVLDLDNNVICIIVKEVFNKQVENKISVPVVIMAGGKGSRLKPYTDVLPKPLLPIGEKTIIEHIIDRFREQGCSDFSIIVNFKKNLIRTYMDGLEEKYNWQLYEESEFLGTAGGLKLIENDINCTFIVSNCDVLVNLSYYDLLNYHKENNNIISVVCARKKVVVPYGVIDVDETNKAIGLKEKPEYEVIVNTGIYVLEPSVISNIPENTFVHITEIMEEYIRQGGNVGTYIINEDDWLDMGQFSQMSHMKEILL